MEKNNYIQISRYILVLDAIFFGLDAICFVFYIKKCKTATLTFKILVKRRFDTMDFLKLIKKKTPITKVVFFKPIIIIVTISIKDQTLPSF